MKVVLRTDVTNVGKKGDICDVADGFGRNFLVPKGQAIVATAGVMAQAASMRRARETMESRDRETAQQVAQSLNEVTVLVEARAGSEGKLFGSVTAADVAAAIQNQTGVEVDRRRIEMEPIKSLGDHRVQLKLHAEVPIELPITVTAS